FERCLCRCQTRNRNPEWTATYIIQTETVTKLDARRFAAGFAANSQFGVWPGVAAEIARYFHQAAHAFLVNRRKRICIDDIELGIRRKEATGIVPTHSERRLG